MATHTGDEGSVYVGANQVAEVREFSFTESIDLFDDTAKGDTYVTHLNGKKSWEGSISCWWDETDTNGQGALGVGSSVTLNLYVEGNASTDTYYTGTATVTSFEVNSPENGTVEASFSFTGNGALTESTVA